MADFVLAQHTKDKIRELKGKDVKLVGRLFLKFQRDICSEYLMIPQALLLSLILHSKEKEKLANDGDSIPVKLIEPEGVTSLIKLVKKGNGMYVFGSQDEWKNVVSRNRFRVEVPVDLWSFVDGESTRFFVMQYVHGLINQATANTVTVID